MSQVIVTKDEYGSKRKVSGQQEKNIQKNILTLKWQMSDATNTMMLERIIAMAAAPVALFWGLIFCALSTGIGIALGIFRFFGLMPKE